jgi:two-component system, LytTR family, response regulator
VRIRALIVDDERIAREGVRGLLESEADIEVIGECADGPAAVDVIKRDNPDLVLLDVEMPVMDGFEVIRALGDHPLPVVVFLTAYSEHALRAFDAQAIDYVVKPFSDARFRKMLARVRTQVHQRERPEPFRYLARLPIRSLGKTTFVCTQDVMWIGASDYYAEIHTIDGKTLLLRETMAHLEARLDPDQFCRIHRSAIVRIDSIAQLRTSISERQVAVLRDGTRLPVGRNRRHLLESALKGMAHTSD